MSKDVIKTFLRLTPNFTEETITGEVRIQVNLIDSTQTVVLNSKMTEISDVKVNHNLDNVLKGFEIKSEQDELILTLNNEIKDYIEIAINFTSKINNEFFAFYKANVHENNSYLLVTHCAYGETRRAFPCFDDPQLKSVFELELVINSNLLAVFNTEVKSEKILGEGKKLLVFEPTPKMPPDILFFGIGDLDILEKTKDGKKFRFIAEKPKATNYGSFALDSLADAFTVSQKYFQYPYPLTKLDLVALDRAYNVAMENWGAISILEPLSLVLDITTNERKDSMQMIISHEVSHQWFGDLVSPTNFKKYIWLNESFATYFGYKTLKENYPLRNVWEKFLKDEFIEAQLRDSLYCSVPIELPGDSIQAIDIVSIPIIYKKGACIIRQLDNFVGFEKFRDGIRAYIEKYAYTNATSEDLWNTLELAVALPIKDFMMSWVSQAGFPWIETSIKGTKLRLTQKRFLYIDQENDQKWLIPISITIYQPENQYSIEVLLDDYTKEITLDHEFNQDTMYFFINETAYGFYHVFYDQKNLNLIMKHKDTLNPTQKYILVTDYFSFIYARKSSIRDYINIILTFKEDINYLLVTTILTHLRYLSIHLNNELFENVKKEANGYLQSILNIVGLEQTDKDTNEILEIRSSMINLLYEYRFPNIVDFAIKNYNKVISNEKIDPSLISSSLNISAKELGEIEILIDKYMNEKREEMKLKYISAIANCKYKENSPVFDFCLNRVHNRHIENLIGTLSYNKTFNKNLLPFVIKNLDFFTSKNFNIQQTIFYMSVINSKDNRQNIAKFMTELAEKHPEHKKMLELAKEENSVYYNLYELKSIN